ncbi:putative NOT transcription complex subunit VIP2 [Hordeum vulgare]|nr:putative NOT transcription complex subunit VIP2 [Hordeum vulgare]
MKGWGANLGHNLSEGKRGLLESIQALDLRADSSCLSPDEWLLRYDLEDQPTVIYIDEEAFWCQRGTHCWVLCGDANMAYFEDIANGRRCRNTVPILWDGETLLQHPAEICADVDGFYKALFSPSPRGGMSLDPSFSASDQRISDAENATLTAPFSQDEAWTTIKGMNPASALLLQQKTFQRRQK